MKVFRGGSVKPPPDSVKKLATKFDRLSHGLSHGMRSPRS